MDILFLHQNMPGQFRHLAPFLARNPDNRVVFLTQVMKGTLPGILRLGYRLDRKRPPSAVPWLAHMDRADRHGRAVADSLLALRRQGFLPDVIVAHQGWGEALYVKDVFPESRLLSYCEFFYHPENVDVGFAETPVAPSVASRMNIRARNAFLLMSLEACDHGLSPTRWQRDLHPAVYRPQISVIHEGIDTSFFRPDPAAALRLPDGRVVRAGDAVVTYATRGMEPYRGFPTFMRALPALLEAHPEALVLIGGADEVHYTPPREDGRTWKEAMLDEVGPLDPRRVVFLGSLALENYRTLLQVSAAHVYLTYPFVLSWSALEAMACGCALVASRTPPVEEVMREGENARLVDFFDAPALAARLAEALVDRHTGTPLRVGARQTILEGYELSDCLRRQTALIGALAAGASPPVG